MVSTNHNKTKNKLIPLNKCYEVGVKFKLSGYFSIKGIKSLNLYLLDLSYFVNLVKKSIFRLLYFSSNSPILFATFPGPNIIFVCGCSVIARFNPSISARVDGVK